MAAVAAPRENRLGGGLARRGIQRFKIGLDDMEFRTGSKAAEAHAESVGKLAQSCEAFALCRVSIPLAPWNWSYHLRFMLIMRLEIAN